MCCIWEGINSLRTAFCGPKYSGKHLKDVLREKLGDSRLHDTLTNLVIPTFDIKKMQPVIFNSYQLNTFPSMDAKLSDICIGTSAAPTFLPAYQFQNPEKDGEKFNLIDGGVAANNPTLVAISEVITQITAENPDFFHIKLIDYGKFLVISIGTGSSKHEFDAIQAGKWGMLLGWLVNVGSNPLIDVFTESSADMVDFHISVFFKALHCKSNYLRIQEDELTGDTALIDKATKENMENLSKIGEKLLKKEASRVNFAPAISKAIPHGGTNEDQLIRFAKMLSEEKKNRMMG